MNLWRGFKRLRIRFSLHAAISSPSWRPQNFQISDMYKLGFGEVPVVIISRPTSFPLKPQLSCGGSIFIEGLTFQERNIANKFCNYEEKCVNYAVYLFCQRTYSFLRLCIGVSSLSHLKYTLETQHIIKKNKINLFSNVLFCVIKQNYFFNVHSNIDLF
jgi:hypothetical protein